ncbi:hypothetical protein P9112_012321 [Eukaryota sp. TZLM1-RC]
MTIDLPETPDSIRADLESPMCPQCSSPLDSPRIKSCEEVEVSEDNEPAHHLLSDHLSYSEQETSPHISHSSVSPNITHSVEDSFLEDQSEEEENLFESPLPPSLSSLKTPPTIETTSTPPPLDLNKVCPVTLETSPERISSRIERLSKPKAVTPKPLSKSIEPPERSPPKGMTLAERQRELKKKRQERQAEFAAKRAELLQKKEEEKAKKLEEERKQAMERKRKLEKQRKARLERIANSTSKITEKPVNLSWSKDGSKRSKDALFEEITEENRRKREMRNRVEERAKNLLNQLNSPAPEGLSSPRQTYVSEDEDDRPVVMSKGTWERLTSPKKASREIKGIQQGTPELSPVKEKKPAFKGLPRVAQIKQSNEGLSPRQLIEKRREEFLKKDVAGALSTQSRDKSEKTLEAQINGTLSGIRETVKPSPRELVEKRRETFLKKDVANQSASKPRCNANQSATDQVNGTISEINDALSQFRDSKSQLTNTISEIKGDVGHSPEEEKSC